MSLVSTFEKSKIYVYKSSIPIIRMFYRKKEKEDLEGIFNKNSLLPEILYLSVLLLSLRNWSEGLQSVGSIVTYTLWAIILALLFTLALTNAKTMLLPNVLVRPFTFMIILYQIVFATQSSNGSLLISALIGGLVLGGIPYLLFQISSGRWIGGGDVKLGFAIGLLLGWKLSLLCAALMLILVLLSFLIEYIAGKLSKTHTPSRMPTGVLWTVSAILCILINPFA